ncbi:parasitophorous vacuolar protein 5, putative [Plasmodium chabaudi chabaudi]|uniref:Parasitophorous vacuolar protein 5, putative n=1 Tax=Plasmodium chabaudi chabaudi TaxID=31271 RepID=A0A4V0K736_PLACU|nr:parasitophorous vacuolar protein 5, putative [Plasmodium chabaudi chabaudi]VTZ68478.1 parasitophorous vacuolar protein 5, putative [Plasmodium chabaudi chabaudi]|eukprot:XP_016653828.1 conserved Plasmodium protein, unknown function [Plasmodium chabaudi chabaudi]
MKFYSVLAIVLSLSFIGASNINNNDAPADPTPDNPNNDGNVHILTKNIDLKQLQGTYYEIATNASDKIFPGLLCRCTKYDFSGLRRDGNSAYMLVNYACDRNFIFGEKKSELLFKLILNKPVDENTTVVDEFNSSIFAVQGNQQILLNSNLNIIYAETNDQNEYEHLIIAGTKSIEPMIILSKYRTVLLETYNKLLNALYVAGYDPSLLNWPFILQTDQTFCD